MENKIWFSKVGQSPSVDIEYWKVKQTPALRVLHMLRDDQKMGNSKNNPIIIQNKSRLKDNKPIYQLTCQCTNEHLSLLSTCFDALKRKGFSSYYAGLSQKECDDLFLVADQMNCVSLCKLLLCKQEMMPTDIKQLYIKPMSLETRASIVFPENTITSGISPDGTLYAIATDKDYWLYTFFSQEEPKELLFTDYFGTKIKLNATQGYKIKFNSDNFLIGLFSKDHGQSVISFYREAQCKSITYGSRGFFGNHSSDDNNKLLTLRVGEFCIINRYYPSLYYLGSYEGFKKISCNNGGGEFVLVKWSLCDRYIVFFRNQNHQNNELFIIDRLALPSFAPNEEYINIDDYRIHCNIVDEPVHSLAWSTDSTLCATLSLRRLSLFNVEGKRVYVIEGKIFDQLKDCEHSLHEQCNNNECCWEKPFPPCSPFCKGEIAFSADSRRCFVEQAKKNGILIITINADSNSYDTRLIPLQYKKLGVENTKNIKTIFTPDGARLVVLEDNKELFCYESLTGQLINSIKIEEIAGECSLQCDQKGDLLFLSHKNGIHVYRLGNANISLFEENLQNLLELSCLFHSTQTEQTTTQTEQTTTQTEQTTNVTSFFSKKNLFYGGVIILICIFVMKKLS